MGLALIRGLLLGVAAGIPVGPVNAAVVDTAMRKCLRRAIAVGMGGALVDFLYSQLAVTGLLHLFERVPELSTLLIGAGGIVLVLFGIKTMAAPPPDASDVHTDKPVARALLAAFGSGVLITLMNPAALISWLLLAGTVLADLSRWEALIAGLGIFAGCSAWFVGIAWLAARGRVRLGHRAVWVTRAVGVSLAVYGVFLVGKASVVVWAMRP